MRIGGKHGNSPTMKGWRIIPILCALSLLGISLLMARVISPQCIQGHPDSLSGNPHRALVFDSGPPIHVSLIVIRQSAIDTEISEDDDFIASPQVTNCSTSDFFDRSFGTTLPTIPPIRTIVPIRLRC